MTKSKFEYQLLSKGYKPVLVRENSNGFHARLENKDLDILSNEGFTEVITEGMYFPVVRLSYEDANLMSV